MVTTSEWNEIRDGLRAHDVQELRRAIVRVGKIKTGELPEDIADGILKLFSHPGPEIRAEAIFAVGLHWRLPSTVKPIAEVLGRDDDLHVQLRAISALGAIGREHAGTKCFVSKVLARVVLSERFADDERMTAYVELQYVEGSIGFKEALRRDQGLPDKLADFEIDRPWVEELMRHECPEP
jgi:HEAT repeat protein